MAWNGGFVGKAASPPCEAKSTAIFGNGTEENDVLCNDAPAALMPAGADDVR